MMNDEHLRARVNEQSQALACKLGTLSQQHSDLLNSTQLTLIAKWQISTQRLCISSGVIDLGNDILLFGYRLSVNPISVNDVFSTYQIEKTADSYEIRPLENSFFDSSFISDFNDLYRNFPNTYLSQLHNVNYKKLAIFKTGPEEVKVFWWSVEPDGSIRYRGKEDNVSLPAPIELQEQDKKFFADNELASMTCPNIIRSPNGEEALYVFHHQDKQVLFCYSKKEVQQIIGSGYTILEDGRLIIFGTKDDAPTQEHLVQLWQTPYVSKLNDSPLARVSRVELERGLSEAYYLQQWLEEWQPTQTNYENVIVFIDYLRSTFPWLDHENNFRELQNLLKSTVEETVKTPEISNHQLALPMEIPPDETCLGQYRFKIHTRSLEFTIIPYQNDRLALHLNGTDFFEPIEDPELNAARDYWRQSVVAESEEVYRGEYLAFSLLDLVSFPTLRTLTWPELQAKVHDYARDYNAEGYELGVHDIDAALILEKLLPLCEAAGLLRFSSVCRSIAQLFWAYYAEPNQGKIWKRSVKNLAQLETLFNGEKSPFATQLLEELSQAITHFLEAEHLQKISVSQATRAAEYLIEELKNDPINFTFQATAKQLVENFWQALDQHNQRRSFEEDLRLLKSSLVKQFALASSWLTSYTAATQREISPASYLEATTLLLTGKKLGHQVNATHTQVEISGLLGHHPRLQEGCLVLQLDEFFDRLHHFMTVHVPAFHSYRQRCQQFLEQENYWLNEFITKKPPTSMVLNRLTKEVYLDLIGANLTQQWEIGKPPLLLMAPPGYGKTTLVEYVAHRLGLALISIDCASLGSQVTSLDPALAPHAQARQELVKLNFAFLIGNHVMLFLDNVQHSHPEFLQTWLTRSLVGVWKNRTVTYQLGKSFSIVMAAELPLKIPETLLNRVEVHNLAYFALAKEELFNLSFLENALPANPVLAPLSNQLEEIYKLLRITEVPTQEAGHLKEIVIVLKHLLHIKEVVSKVNQHYLSSLLQTAPGRLEPPFRLQGNYYTMNKLASKIQAKMSHQEVDRLIEAHYVAQAYALKDTEENLLKLAEIRGTLTKSQASRWAEIKNTFQRLQSWGDDAGDLGSRLIKQLTLVAERLQHIHAAMMQVSEIKQWSAYLATLPKLVNALTKIQMDVEVVNQLPTGLEDSLKIMIEMVEKTLLPIVQEYERKSKLDLIMFERIREMSQMLKEVQQEIALKSKLYKKYKALNLKE